MRPEPRIDAADVAREAGYMAGLALDANPASLTMHATAMPYIGRG